jgi:hypothetical protein
MFNRSITNNSFAEAKKGVITGEKIAVNTKVNPLKVIKLAKGTIRILATTVIGEKILK